MGFLFQVLFVLLIRIGTLLRGILRFFRPPRTQNHLSVFLMPGIGTVTRSFQTIESSRIFVLLFWKQIPVFRYIIKVQSAPHIELSLSGIGHVRFGKVQVQLRHASFQNQLYLLMVVSNRFATLTGHRHNGRTVNFSRFILACLRSARHIFRFWQPAESQGLQFIRRHFQPLNRMYASGNLTGQHKNISLVFAKQFSSLLLIGHCIKPDFSLRQFPFKSMSRHILPAIIIPHRAAILESIHPERFHLRVEIIRFCHPCID